MWFVLTSEKKKEYFSIPNLLCYLRLLLLPVFVLFFCFGQNRWAAAVIFLSAATDVADGIVARKFNMTTEWGKIMDPLADKLTQAVVSACLMVRYPVMLYLFLLILCKEIFQAVGGFLLYRKLRKMRSSEWFGKLSTAFFYGLVAYLVLFFPEPTFWFATMPIAISAGLMALALVLYARRFFQAVGSLRSGKDSTVAESR